ncbi:phosphatidylglycerophosphatase A [Desulfomicrobium sp. ZS1]|jgi:phosphatidylglycerophosphatase A|uniref:phosphatidylglycerophosphatase A family protein n=1 Tax=Desulfomicrobium sp. ZS1 TaxID=2952228 RepID=UPI0020B2A2C5|nr:phosphatidylglycerophosphatase A [Desulfomicrobium sp. ZS1]UTF50865.1 phosphatidylglycerophosphatase A [Desulfomicrobium sp. ZS1]
MPDKSSCKGNWLESLPLNLATLGAAGRMPKAPGTWGSLVAAILAPFLFLPLPIWGRIVVLLLLFPFGSWCAGKAEKSMCCKDPSCVVVDELWGQWITLLPLAVSDTLWIIPAFLFFRLFDITKPWPVRASERWLPGGWGIMIDDGLAGLYALMTLLLCRALF